MNHDERKLSKYFALLNFISDNFNKIIYLKFINHLWFVATVIIRNVLVNVIIIVCILVAEPSATDEGLPANPEDTSIVDETGPTASTRY
jgi:hypothetical protein